LAWLEAVSTGVEMCSFVIDEEGSLVEFKATTLNSGKVRFQITPNSLPSGEQGYVLSETQ
jgi:hypothetical protein